MKFFPLLCPFFRLVRFLILPMMRLKSKSSIGLRLNNPFNIRYSALNQWRGQKGHLHGFCHFESIVYGVRAFAILYRTYINKYNVTVQQFVYRYAPPNENNSYAYLRSVCRLTRFASDYRLTPSDLVRFGAAVLQVEQGSARADVVALLKLY